MPMPAARPKVPPRVGTLVESPGAYPHLSGAVEPRNPRRRRGLTAAHGPVRRARIGTALEQVGLSAADRRPVRAYSQGMRQRLGLGGRSAAQSAPLLILDEPSNGLDPQGIQEIRRLLLKLNYEGTTIFLSSHLLAEIEQMCTHVGVLHSGRLMLQERSGHLAATDWSGRGPYP